MQLTNVVITIIFVKLVFNVGQGCEYNFITIVEMNILEFVTQKKYSGEILFTKNVLKCFVIDGNIINGNM